MKEEILKILGKYKVIGDHTFGLGYEDAEKLAEELEMLFKEKVGDKSYPHS